jgi:hypothetical protein
LQWSAALVVLAMSPAWARKPAPKRLPGAVKAEAFGSFQYQFSDTERVEVASGKTIIAAIGRTRTPWTGWFPIRVFVDNTQGPKQTIRLGFTSLSGNNRTEVVRIIDVEAGERQTVALTVPAEVRWGTLEASSPVIGKQSGPIGLTPVYDRARIVLNLGTPPAFESIVGGPNNVDGEDQVLTMPLDEAPVELTAYVGFHAVVVSDEKGLGALSDAQRVALEGWVASGGSLVLTAPPSHTEFLPLLDAYETGTQPYGFGNVTVLHDSRHFLSTPMASVPVQPLGQIQGRRSFEVDGLSTYRPLLPQAFVPVGRFLLIITLFTVLIGPGSVYLARRRGPALLLATIPATAFVTCLVILASSMLVDGFSVHATAYGFTLLDRERHRAITLGLTGWYANLSPRSVDYSSTTSVIAPRKNGEPTPVELTWADGQRYGSNFIPSRTYREWGQLSVTPSRARLVVKRRENGLALQNALGHRIDSVWVRSGETLYTANNVPDGAEVPLTRDERVVLTELAHAAENRFIEAAWKPMVMAPLQEGQFLARLDGTGFVSTGGVRVKLHEGKHVVRGEIEP